MLDPQRKNLVVPYHDTITEKYVISFLSTVLLYGTWKNSIDIRPPPKKKSFWQQFHYGVWDLQKNLIRLDHHWKKKLNWHSIPTEINIYFRFRLMYYYGTWDLKKINLTAPSPKKNRFLFLTTVLLWCTGLTKFLIGTGPYRNFSCL